MTNLPDFKSTAFNCPFCNAYAHMTWETIRKKHFKYSLHTSECAQCHSESIWRLKLHNKESTPITAVMLYPDTNLAIIPATDMPNDVKEDFEEAKSIFNKSPKAAAALLRLALQKLCKHLGEPGKNINTDIKSLVEKNILNADITKAADTVRITGNNAVHPGEMNDEDIDFVASRMFDLINYIVVRTITDPKELEALYTTLPEGARAAIEKRDAPKD